MFIPGDLIFYFNVCKQTDRKFDVLLYIWCKAILISGRKNENKNGFDEIAIDFFLKSIIGLKSTNNEIKY